MKPYKVTIIFLLFAALFAGVGCSSTADSIAQPGINPVPSYACTADWHYIWAAFRAALSPDGAAAVILPQRETEAHFDVTQRAIPPQCDDCVQIIGSAYHPADNEWHLTVQLKNNGDLPGYNVRGLVHNLGDKYLKNPDGFMDIYLSEDMSFKEFAKDSPDRRFGPGSAWQETYIFHFPLGDDWLFVDYIIDASWPDNCQEPVIENISFPPVLLNDVDKATMTANALDQQDDFFIVMADLTPIGGEPTALFDNGVNNDGKAHDGLFGAKDIVASCAPGEYIIELYACDIHLRYGRNSVRVKVTGGTNQAPVIDGIEMSRTTCTVGNPDDTVVLACVAHDPNPLDVLEYHWSCTGGSIQNETGQTTVWNPPYSVGKFHVTCVVTDGNGGETQMQSGKIRVTAYTLKGTAPAFSCERLSGTGDFQLADYSPGNVVMLSFWSTLCAPCIAEFPLFQEILDGYAGFDFALITLSLDTNKNKAKSWIEGHSYEFTEWGWDQGEVIFNVYNDFINDATNIPQTFIIDNDGNVRYARAGGISNPSTYTDVIDELV